jgi:agmatine/peptidylarginine deiminase
MVKQAIPKYTGNTSNISFIPFATNHLWVRDTGPVYVLGTGDARSRRFAINFRFREWGKRDEMEKQDRAPDGLDWPIMNTEQLDENATFARRVIETDVSPSPVTLVESRVCLEGGALVVDGEGTLLATKSSIINDNRNAGLSRSEIEPELRRLLGVEKIIWFPGRKGLDITDVHVDAEVNFIRPGVVVLSRPHASPWLEVYEEIRDILTRSVDAKGRPFEIHTVDEPDPALLGHLSYDEPATNYVNFYFVNGGLILPQFGDELRDRAAVETFQKLCPGRVIRPVYVHTLPLAGGVIHCATQPVIAVQED